MTALQQKEPQQFLEPLSHVQGIDYHGPILSEFEAKDHCRFRRSNLCTTSNHWTNDIY
jgi:hypothetical protein